MAVGSSLGGLAQVGNLTKVDELKRRILFVLGALIVYRIGAHIPTPGIDPDALANFFSQQQGSMLGLFDMFSGGALSRLTVFALGIMPYISASIILQLGTVVSPKLEQLKKEGEAGRRKINVYTRYLTVALATFQGLGVSIALESMESGGSQVVLDPGWGFRATTVITLVAGTTFLMWLGERITEKGIGNGISLIIFAAIVSGLPSALYGTLELARTGEFQPLFVLFLLLMALAVTGFIVFMERAQRRITIQYAKRQVGQKMFGGQSTHLPLKVNMAGVIPPIFASSIILFPVTAANWFGTSEGMGWLQRAAEAISPGQPLYVVLYSIAIIFFCFFYTAIVFNPRDTADNLKKSGGFIPGIRPGEQTANYVDRVLTRLTFFGALYVTAVCLLPEFLIVNWNVPFYFGGTSLLIIVAVTMDTANQIQSHLVSHQYEGLMRKARLKGGRG
ncbi:preprotein translocase subunit SecY [Thiohalorhabdus denitrificans]|uniref:Protein translocase subunit SecY n=1 Tax=Thiohalorhabdus denitrificans TaxID=381306 RepID=A0A0P9EF60_9GAMM|nr:preprotein translocase subunit SecY [Thiohalorhabdus denitrificans]KPV40974.1 preprotein translocase subunit SecY [Thiohalorhabdus denitrificans]SCY42958.1 protein translocase subunit secY/sec61 alpha [Thiohalorhabdus denitrificans]